MNISEGNTALASVNNAIRKAMADIRSAIGLPVSFLGGSSALPVANGGTGGTSASAARAGIGAAAAGANSDITALNGLTTALAVARGGTGSTTVDGARNALRAVGITSYSLTAAGGYISFRFNDFPLDFKLQWGSQSFVDGTTTVTYPVAFNSWSVPVISGGSMSVEQINGPFVISAGTSSFSAGSRLACTGFWLAIGV